jgi:outer membrane protein
MRSSLISATALLCLAFGAFAQAPAKVGVISMQGALVGTKDGQKASQELETKWAPKKKEMDARGAEISQLEDQMRKGGSLMSEDKRSQTLREIDEKKKRYQRDAQDAQEELNQDQNKVLQSLAQRLYAVVEKYAKDNGYTMIIDVSAQNTPVLYASSGVDITQDIIALYDKTSTNGGPATTPGAITPGATTLKPAPKPATPPGR